MDKLISVVIPAFNAEATLPETIRSVRAQTIKALDVIIVNDGSTDQTISMAKRICDSDARFRLITTDNHGVAAARNVGISAAMARFVSFLDADDIWHPRKLELQLRLFNESSEALGLVYNWFHRVDRQSRVVGTSAMDNISGAVLGPHLDWNFISNGSTPMVPTSIAREIGFDTGLRASGNQGCEDYLFQLQIARRYRFGCVPAFLTGYRCISGSMSSNVARMIRSHLQVMQQMRPLAPEYVDVINRREAEFHVELARNRLRRRIVGEGLRELGRAARLAPLAAAIHARRQIPRPLAKVGPNPTPQGADYYALDPFAPLGRPTAAWRVTRWRRLAELAGGSNTPQASQQVISAPVSDGDSR